MEFNKVNIIKKPYYLLSIILLFLLSACGSNPNISPESGAVNFNIKLSRSLTVNLNAYLTGNNICSDYGIETISAAVLNSSSDIVTSVSWSCAAHEGTITGVPAGSNYTVSLDGIDSNNSITWRGEKSGIDIISGATAVAGTITMTYIGSDTAAPTVTPTSPSGNATDIPVTTSLTATFSEKMALSSINISTFTVSNGSTSVSGSVTYDPDTMKVTFIPSGSLSYSTTYTALITANVEDMAGNNMQSDYSWSFNTEAPPTAPAAPTGVSVTSGNSQLTIAWDTVMGATSYDIYWSTASGVTKTTGTKIANVSSPYTHTGLTNGTSYYYVVTAVNTYGESSESSQILVIPQAPISLPKTGQTTCYDSSGNEIECTGTGQDGDIQAGVVWPTPRFIDNGDDTVTDDLTALVWTKDGNAPGTASCSPAITKTWQGALDYVACLNTNGYLGYTDWRLPNVNELRSLVHAGQINTATWLNTQGFNNVQGLYWSSTSYANSNNSAWAVYMVGGWLDGFHKDQTYDVWPVRSDQSGSFGNSVVSLPKTGQMASYATGDDGDLTKGIVWPTPRFTIGTGAEADCVTDNLTGLMWVKSPDRRSSWADALTYVNGLSLCGFSDWRLPNRKELENLINYGQTNSVTWLNNEGFSNVPDSYYYWSSTSYVENSKSYSAWSVVMPYGSWGNYDKDSVNIFAWPVRAGQ